MGGECSHHCAIPAPALKLSIKLVIKLYNEQATINYKVQFRLVKGEIWKVS